MNELSLIQYDPKSTSIFDSPYIQDEFQYLYEIASSYVSKKIPIGEGYTGPEALAMIYFSMLEMVNGMDLANIVLRGKLIREIEKHGLWENLPGNYESAEQAIEARARLSRTQQYAIKNLCDHVFPYIESLGMTVPEFYEKIGKSNAQDALPALRAIITGEPSKSPRVNNAVERIMREVDPENTLPPAERKRQAVEQVIEAATLTNAEMNKRLYGSTDPISFNAIRKDGTIYLMAEINNDQLKMLHNVMGDNMDIAYADLDETRVEKLTVLREFLVKLFFAQYPKLEKNFKTVSHSLSELLRQYREEMVEVLE